MRSIVLLVSLLGGPAIAQAAPADRVQFQISYTPGVPGGHLTTIPRLEVITSGLPLTATASAQLSEVVGREISERGLDPMYATIAEGGRWRLQALSEPRQAVNAALAAGFGRELGRCFASLPPHLSTGDLYVLLQGFAPINAAMVASARQAGQRMAQNLAASGCASALNSSEVSTERLENVAAGLIADGFDGRLFPGALPVILADLLQPLFFGRSGLWVREKSPALRDLVVAGVGRGLPTPADLDALGAERPSFLDWLADALALRPDLSVGFVDAVVASCLGPNEDAVVEPFSLARCVDDGKVSLVPVEVGASRFLLATPVLP